jgi:toluene monooxygenase system ferredoxin subunit
VTSQAIASVDSIGPGERAGVVVGSVKVLLVNLDGTIHAYENRCAHRGALLSSGKLSGHILTCSAHEWCYDASTGCGINPASARLRRFPIQIEDGFIFVDVGDESDRQT